MSRSRITLFDVSRGPVKLIRLFRTYLGGLQATASIQTLVYQSSGSSAEARTLYMCPQKYASSEAASLLPHISAVTKNLG
jgi:hypothetical protein